MKSPSLTITHSSCTYNSGIGVSLEKILMPDVPHPMQCHWHFLKLLDYILVLPPVNVQYGVPRVGQYQQMTLEKTLIFILSQKVVLRISQSQKDPAISGFEPGFSQSQLHHSITELSRCVCSLLKTYPTVLRNNIIIQETEAGCGVRNLGSIDFKTQFF